MPPGERAANGDGGASSRGAPWFVGVGSRSNAGAHECLGEIGVRRHGGWTWLSVPSVLNGCPAGGWRARGGEGEQWPAALGLPIPLVLGIGAATSSASVVAQARVVQGPVLNRIRLGGWSGRRHLPTQPPTDGTLNFKPRVVWKEALS